MTQQEHMVDLLEEETLHDSVKLNYNNMQNNFLHNFFSTAATYMVNGKLILVMNH